MNPLLKALMHPYLDAAEEGKDLPGAVDRGDNLEPEAKQEPETHDDKVEDFVGKKEDAEGGEKKDDQPRDEGGKFTKKERPVPDHVPRERMNEAVDRERAAREAAERRAAELEAQLQQEAKSVDVQKMEDAVEALEKQHAKLLLDGEGDKAAAVMKEIRQAERAIARMETEATASRATAAAVEKVRMDATIAGLEASYPAFNPDSEKFDQDLVDIVLAEQARLIQTDRMSPSQALQTAATKIMKKFGPSDEPAKEQKGLGAAGKENDRKQEQVAKNLDTAKRQPASMKDSGKDSDKAGEGKIDVGSLTKSEFDALPESTKRRLRGDDL